MPTLSGSLNPITAVLTLSLYHGSVSNILHSSMLVYLRLMVGDTAFNHTDTIPSILPKSIYSIILIPMLEKLVVVFVQK